MKTGIPTISTEGCDLDDSLRAIPRPIMELLDCPDWSRAILFRMKIAGTSPPGNLRKPIERRCLEN